MAFDGFKIALDLNIFMAKNKHADINLFFIWISVLAGC